MKLGKCHEMINSVAEFNFGERTAFNRRPQTPSRITWEPAELNRSEYPACLLGLFSGSPSSRLPAICCLPRVQRPPWSAVQSHRSAGGPRSFLVRLPGYRRNTPPIRPLEREKEALRSRPQEPGVRTGPLAAWRWLAVGGRSDSLSRRPSFHGTVSRASDQCWQRMNIAV